MSERMITVCFTKDQLERYMKGKKALVSPLSSDHTYAMVIPVNHIIGFDTADFEAVSIPTDAIVVQEIQKLYS